MKGKYYPGFAGNVIRCIFRVSLQRVKFTP